MADVACFCGCCYSFEGGGGSCPGCGRYASISTGPDLTPDLTLELDELLAAAGAPAPDARAGRPADR